MAREKGALRRELTPRRLRWRASRALIGAAPFLRRRLNFHGAAIALEEAAEQRLFEDAMTVDRPFSEAEIRFIEERCRRHDGPAEPEYWRAPWRFSVSFYAVRSVEMLSHTGCLADGAGRGLVTADGEAENWNRDKIALLRRAPAVSGVALPVRRYTNYFHFMLEAAMPLVAYLTHPARRFGPHAIVSAPIAAGFARETLKAIAARFGADFIEQKPGTKTPLETAVAWVRRSPCSDWPMARPETAQELRDALLAYFERSPDPAARRRLYLRRGRTTAKIRHLLNADALDALSAERGFEALEPASANLAEQACWTAESDTVLAVHGAALGNLLFARPGTAVREVFPGDFCKSVYMALCRQLGLEHRYVVGGVGDYRQNFEADIDAVAAMLPER